MVRQTMLDMLENIKKRSRDMICPQLRGMNDKRFLGSGYRYDNTFVYIAYTMLLKASVTNLTSFGRVILSYRPWNRPFGFTVIALLGRGTFSV